MPSDIARRAVKREKQKKGYSARRVADVAMLTNGGVYRSRSRGRDMIVAVLAQSERPLTSIRYHGRL
eukprot:8751876-Pyramimonas_sp.AAC.1